LVGWGIAVVVLVRVWGTVAVGVIEFGVLVGWGIAAVVLVLVWGTVAVSVAVWGGVLIAVRVGREEVVKIDR